MKTKITTLFTLLFLGLNLGLAQDTEYCTVENLSIFHEKVKAKNYDAAYDTWLKFRNQCPKFNLAIYVDGEKILKDKIENSTAGDKVAFLKDLQLLWDQRIEHFSSKTKIGETLAEKAQLMYDERELLNKSDEELYAAFDEAYTKDKSTFANPKSLYTYFSLMVDLYDQGKRSAQQLFDKYDNVSEKINNEIENYTGKVDKLLAKEHAGQALSNKETKAKKYYESYLNAYDKIAGSIDSKLGKRADCSNLIPLYSKDFEANKTDAAWLQSAVSRMAAKDCTDDPLFFKLVNAYHNTNPSADTAYYLGILKDKEGRTSEAISYYNQAVNLETDSDKKAKMLYRIAVKLKTKGNYSSAREYFRKALKESPSMGKCYSAIAEMYAKSANSCGDDSFSKRAIYWLAASEARKGGFESKAKYYESLAPTKSDVFAKGNAGQTIKFTCWVGGSVVVPN